MRERAAFEKELTDLQLDRARRSKWLSVEPDYLETRLKEELHDFGISPLPETLREMEIPNGCLAARPDGEISLQDKIEEFLCSLGKGQYDEMRKGRLCFEMSLKVFAEVCKGLGVKTETVMVGKDKNRRTYEVPYTRRWGMVETTRRNLVRRFLYLWFSSVFYKNWSVLDKVFRGAGAPGALRYAGLLQGSDYICSSDYDLKEQRWPAGLKPGAFLQLWPDEQTFKNVQSGKEEFGHSCIFRDYKDERKNLIVTDRISLKNVWTCGLFTKYLIGANLSRVDVLEM